MDRVSLYEDAVSRPGRFEGEPRWVPYFYDQATGGCADGFGEEYDWFRIGQEDINIFPELHGHKSVILTYSDDGFVYGELDVAEPETFDLGGES